MEFLILFLKFTFMVFGFFSPIFIFFIAMQDKPKLINKLDKSIYITKLIVITIGFYCIIDTSYKFIWSL